MTDNGFHAMDHRTRSQKQHRLKIGVGHQVEQARAVSSHAHGHNHVAQLGNGGVGQPFFNVVLGNGDAGPHKGGESTDPGDRVHHRREMFKHREHPRHQKDPSSHHGCSMDQGRNGGWAFHGIGEPNMEGKLSRLGHGTEEDQHPKEGGKANANDPRLNEGLQPLPHHLKLKATRRPIEAQHPQQQAKVADPVGDKGFLAGIGCGLAIEPEAHQQVGAHAHQFPKNINLHQVRTHDEAQHGGTKQAQISVKPHIARIVAHIAIGVDHHQQRHRRHHHQH